jgi:uncharacterized protein
MTVRIVENPEQQRYEVYEDDKLAGFAEYRRREDAVSLTHTEIDPAFGGKGLAGSLIKHALDEARGQGSSVLPFCSFVQNYIRKHPEHLDLVPADQRAKFEL